MTVHESPELHGLGAVKGTGWAAIEVILKAREQDGAFKDLFDFCRRLDLRKVNRRVIESLIRAGAFDKLESNRAALLAGVGLAISAAEQSGAASGQNSLFGDATDSVAHTLPNVPAWSDQEQLQQEKTALGFYFSGHPFVGFKKDIANFIRNSLGDLKPSDEVTTIEGLADTVGKDLHPMQEAWIDRDVAQCGYCQPGQIMQAVALVKRKKAEGGTITEKDLDSIRNICRCGTYHRIREAVVQGARKM